MPAADVSLHGRGLHILIESSAGRGNGRKYTRLHAVSPLTMKSVLLLTIKSVSRLEIKKLYTLDLCYFM